MSWKFVIRILFSFFSFFFFFQLHYDHKAVKEIQQIYSDIFPNLKQEDYMWNFSVIDLAQVILIYFYEVTCEIFSYSQQKLLSLKKNNAYTVYTCISCNFLRPKLRPLTTGNCRYFSWPRPSPWTITYSKFVFHVWHTPLIWG